MSGFFWSARRNSLNRRRFCGGACGLKLVRSSPAYEHPTSLGAALATPGTRFVLAQYHQGQMTVPRLLAQLRAFGIVISKRQLVRLLIAGQDGFLAENREVLRAGLSSAAWVTVDDTGARHKAANGFCTQIGNAPTNDRRSPQHRRRRRPAQLAGVRGAGFGVITCRVVTTFQMAGPRS